MAVDAEPQEVATMDPMSSASAIKHRTDRAECLLRELGSSSALRVDLAVRVPDSDSGDLIGLARLATVGS